MVERGDLVYLKTYLNKSIGLLINKQRRIEENKKKGKGKNRKELKIYEN